MSPASVGNNSNEMLSTRRLKELALAKIPADHPLRDIILAEKEYLTPDEFLAKLEVWLNLMEYKG